MKTTHDDITPRLSRMRDALVERVEAGSPRRTRRPSRGSVIAVVAAFVVGGALTGGLTAAAAAGSGDQNAMESLMATTARYDVETANYGTLLGAPRFGISRGTSEYRLGTPPTGADEVTVTFQCLDPGTFSQKLGSQVVAEPYTCDRAPNASPSTTVPWPNIYRLTSSGPQTVTVEGSGSARYAVWISWAKAGVFAEPSAQQDAETSDKVITLSEYTTAFNRLEACMAQAGHPMADVPLTGSWYYYSTPAGGIAAFDTQCYPREFQNVDDLWQTEHPMP